MRFSRQQYWSALPIPPPGNFPNPGIEPTSPVTLELTGGFFTTESPGKPPWIYRMLLKIFTESDSPKLTLFFKITSLKLRMGVTQHALLLQTAAAAAAKSLQSCPTLCDPRDVSPPGSAVPGILQARTLEWVAISFSSAWKWKVKVKSLSRVRLLATPWSEWSHGVFQAKEYWSGVPLPSPAVAN